MKKLSYLIPAVAVALLTGCASEDVVNPGSGNENQGVYAMTLGSRMNNIGRADLNSLHKDFGVWAYKGANDADKVATGNTVMEHYMVAYTGTEGVGGYTVPTGTEFSFAQESNWFYEKFGYEDGISNNSNVKNQYLKYWDYSKPNTFFYAYAPYVKGTDAPTFTVGNNSDDANKSKLEFKKPVTFGLSNATESNMFFAAKAVPAASYGADVALTFKRFNSKLRIAFFEEIDGYSVEILDLYGADGTNNNVDNATSNYGVIAWAADRADSGENITDEDGNEILDHAGNPIKKYNYTKAAYVNSALPVIEFGALTAGEIPATVTFDPDDATTTEAAIAWKAPTATAIGTALSNASYSATEYNVVPVKDVDATAVKGYRFFISYRLTSLDDSGETITVYNAPVYVPAEYAMWEANKLYTYVFKIVRDSAGKFDPEDPDPTDPDDPALRPIIFNNLIIGDYETPEKSYIFEITSGNVTEVNSTTLPAFE